jgi:hypothetical protein
MRIGYGRVSTRDQHPEAQHDALTAAGCELQIFIDRASGKLARRPELDKALVAAGRAGDQLVVTNSTASAGPWNTSSTCPTSYRHSASTWSCSTRASTREVGQRGVFQVGDDLFDDRVIAVVGLGCEHRLGAVGEHGVVAVGGE